MHPTTVKNVSLTFDIGSNYIIIIFHFKINENLRLENGQKFRGRGKVVQPHFVKNLPFKFLTIPFSSISERIIESLPTGILISFEISSIVASSFSKTSKIFCSSFDIFNI